MAVKRGDVVIAAHGDLGRPRPAIVVQANALGDAATTVLICPLTSEMTEELPIRPIVGPNPENGRRIRSQIMTDKLLAVRRERMTRALGSIDSRTRDELDRALMIVLGLIR